MSCQHNLLLLFLCGFAVLTVSAQTCGEHVLEGTSCSINGKTSNNEKAADIRWSFISSDGTTTQWKKGSNRKPPAGLTIEEDGSLRFESVRQNNTGTYKYTAFDASDTQISAETVELRVYVKAPKPNVKSECKPDGTVTLLCDTGNYKDLHISWYEDDKIMQDETETHLTLTSSKVKENKLYACSVSNPVSSEQSDRITVSYSGPDQVSAQTCGEHVLEGTSCSINGKPSNNVKAADIRWSFISSDGNTTEWKKGSSRKPPAGLTIEEDGSLRFESVRQSNTGTYKYAAFDASDTQISAETVELRVYVKAPKPNVKSGCKPDGTVTLLCDTGNYKDLHISWYEDDKIMQDETETHLTLTSSKVKENKRYACSVSNPASSEHSDRITVSFSAQTCGEHVLEGTSCSINGKTTKNEKAADIRWGFTSSDGNPTDWKKGSSRKPPAGITIEEDGSLRFESVRQNNTGTYKYTAFDASGTQIGDETVELRVYVKAPKPTVTIKCIASQDIVILHCKNLENIKDLTISWYEDGTIEKVEKKSELTLKLSDVINKQYACSLSNPASNAQSERITASCSSIPITLFGFDFWIMIGILAGGGALLLLLCSVLICCACRRCRHKKHRLDAEEFRLTELQPPFSNGTNRSKQTARGQPAPPIPQEESMHCNPSPQSTPQIQPQPKAQIRARPPPPPQDEDEEDPPPLPRPRNKQHRKKHQEPYRPME
ncbi:hemicentin-2 [Danio aesculapii]|uniref:hemicentin-2 n=1 Tax=Danio aesculapii TaxID=1142201 RepID=UPI0024BF42B6|nr:hemicentin-2 [Danio aesculapii]